MAKDDELLVEQRLSRMEKVGRRARMRALKFVRHAGAWRGLVREHGQWLRMYLHCWETGAGSIL